MDEKHFDLEQFLLQVARSSSGQPPAEVHFRHTRGEAAGGFSVLYCQTDPDRDEFFYLKFSDWPWIPKLLEDHPCNWGIGEQGLRLTIIPFLNALGAEVINDGNVGVWASFFEQEPRLVELSKAIDSESPFDVADVGELIDIISRTRSSMEKNPEYSSNPVSFDLKVMDEYFEEVLKVISKQQDSFQFVLEELRRQGFYLTLNTFRERQSK